MSRYDETCERLQNGEARTLPDWSEQLFLTKQGGIKKLQCNAEVPLRYDPAFKDRLRFSEFRQRLECRDVPWSKGGAWRAWRDEEDRQFASWLQRHKIDVTPATAADAAANVGDEHKVHEVRDYLNSLEWDGKQRLEIFAEQCLGADPTNGLGTNQPEYEHYIRDIMPKFFVSAVARIYNPGCKVDTCPILEGPQGIGKSSAILALMPNPEWFADQVADLGTKDSCQDLPGKWIIELPELSAMRSSEVERNKSFLSRSTDHYRPSYGRRSTDFPRQCVFVGTTNDDYYFKDATGNRRFWPFRVGRIDLEAIRRDRDQLWAEAVVAYKRGEQWWLDMSTNTIAIDEQTARYERDPWHDKVMGLVSECGDGGVKPLDILRLLHSEEYTWQQRDINRIVRILKSEGWYRQQRRESGRRHWVYFPCNKDLR